MMHITRPDLTMFLHRNVCKHQCHQHTLPAASSQPTWTSYTSWKKTAFLLPNETTGPHGAYLSTKCLTAKKRKK